MTIEQYLQGKVDFNLNELTIAAILADRNIAEGTQLSTLTQRQKDLALADLYVFVGTSSTSSSGDYESDGGWQRQRANKNVVNRDGLLNLARKLYEKWGESLPDTRAHITMKDLY